jgi:hypothetical protein
VANQLEEGGGSVAIVELPAINDRVGGIRS